uniref:Putative secreted protein n=1 Tax=Anopheles darlingi TaxID=43151 RepID=A0A2M4D2D4_ANODA
MHARGAGWLVFALWPTNPAFCLKFPFEPRRFPYFLICGSLSLSCSLCTCDARPALSCTEKGAKCAEEIPGGRVEERASKGEKQ